MGEFLTVRTLNEDDWADWRGLRLDALAEAPYAFSSKLADWTGPADAEERWRARLRDVPFNVLAELDGRPVGMVSCLSPSGGDAELLSFWVAPTARGRGVGDALVGAVVSWAESLGARRVTLAVREANRPAVAAYQRNGFVDVGPVEHDTHDQEPERRMARHLIR